MNEDNRLKLWLSKVALLIINVILFSKILCSNVFAAPTFVDEYGVTDDEKSATGIAFNPDGSYARGKAVAGTYPYMPPEIIREEGVDEKSDIYSLGVLLHVMIMGGEFPIYPDGPRKNINEYSQYEWGRALDKKPNKAEGVSKNLSSLILKCLSKNPEDRVQRRGCLGAEGATPRGDARDDHAAPLGLGDRDGRVCRLLLRLRLLHDPDCRDSRHLGGRSC